MTEKLTASLNILMMLQSQMNHLKSAMIYISQIKMEAWRSSDKERLFELNTALTSIIAYTFISYNSFKDEFDKYFLSKDKSEMNSVIKIRKSAKKHFKPINNMFNNLKEARNVVLTHGFRNKENIPLTIEEVQGHFDILFNHDNLEPFTMISDNVNSIVKLISDEFTLEFNPQSNFSV